MVMSLRSTTLWHGSRLPLADHDLRRPDPLQHGCCDECRDQHKGCYEPEPSASES
jgi:hypothetical protein